MTEVRQRERVAEMIWRGRLHLGDEPGVYGDAAYAGLGTELPVTLTPSDPNASAEDVALEIQAADVSVFAPYPGHSVSL
jgi:hypothetical protein